METIDVVEESVFLSNYSEDDERINTRAGNLKFISEYTLPFAADRNVELQIPYDSDVRYKPITVELYFHIGRGYVIYTCQPLNNFNQKVSESGLGTFFSSFQTLVSPRRPRGNNSFRFGYVRERSDCFITVEGWRIVKIPNAGSIGAVTLRLVLDVDETPVETTGTVKCRYLDFKSCIRVTSPSELDGKLDVRNLMLSNSTGRNLLKLQPTSSIRLKDVNSLRDLLDEPGRNAEEKKPVVNVATFDDALNNTPGGDDTKRLIRLYFTNKLSTNPNKSFSYNILWPNIDCDGLDVIHQFWLGDKSNMFEGGVRYIHSTDKHTFFFCHRVNDSCRYYKIPFETNRNLLQTRPVDLSFVVSRLDDAVISIDISGFKFITVKIPGVSNKLQIGWEFHLFRHKVGNRAVSDLKSFEAIPPEKNVQVDGVVTTLIKSDFPPDDSNVNGWKIERKPGLRLRDIRHVSELFNKPEPAPDKTDKMKEEESKQSDTKPDGSIEVEEGKIPDGKSQSEDFGLKAVLYQPLTSIEDVRIFKSMVKWYVSKGLTDRQAELLIYQMGISFCTSANSSANSNLGLIISKPNGDLVKFMKSDHVARMQMLANKYCNVERSILRSRSNTIFQLLKNGTLSASRKHARQRGLRPDMAHMACDFMDYTTLPLSDEEVLALSTVQRYVMLKNKHRRSIVNVNQLL
nr:minor coat protein [Sweet potato chlorotic stunt virus]